MTVLPFTRVSTSDEVADLLAAAGILRREFATIGRAQLLEMAANHHRHGAVCDGNCAAAQAARRVLARHAAAAIDREVAAA